MVVLNNSAEAQTLDLSRFSESIKSSTAGVEVLSGKQIALIQTLTVPAKTPMIIELN